MFIGFELAATEVKTVTASTDCVVVFWDLEDLNTLATCRSPALSAFWRNFALCQVCMPACECALSGRGRGGMCAL